MWLTAGLKSTVPPWTPLRVNLWQQQGSGWFADSNVMMSPSAPSSMFLITANVRTSFAFIFSLSLPLYPPPSTTTTTTSVLSLVPPSFLFSLTVSFSPPPPVSLPLSARACLGAHLTKHGVRESEPCLTWHVGDGCEERQGHTLLTAEGKAPLLPLMRLLTAVSNTLCVCVHVCVWACPRSHNKKTERRCRNNEHKNKKEHTNEK